MMTPATIIPLSPVESPPDESEPPRRHALIIGGTGMLRNVSISLLQQYTTVSVLARTSQSLNELRDEVRTTRIHPIRCDWHDSVRLRERVGEAFDLHGMPRLVVCWCHSTARDAPLSIARMVADETADVCFVHVLGSGSPRSSATRRRWVQAISAMPGIDYRAVQLGCERTGHTFRWLDHGVICDAVLGAIESGKQYTFVGDPIP